MTPPAPDHDERLAALTLEGLLESLGDKTPTPGGGAVASIVAALGAELGRMVVNYSRGKKKLAEHEALHERALNSLQALSGRALRLADEDEEAYGRLNELMRLDADDPKRKAEWDTSVEEAIAVPREILIVAAELMGLLETLPGVTNRMLASDLAIAAVLAEAAARSAGWNIHINLPLVADAARRGELRAELDRMLAEATRQRERIEAACRREQ